MPSVAGWVSSASVNVAMLLDLPSMICFDQTAVIDVDGTEVTYGDLRANVSQAAGLLASLRAPA